MMLEKGRILKENISNKLKCLMKHDSNSWHDNRENEIGKSWAVLSGTYTREVTGNDEVLLFFSKKIFKDLFENTLFLIHSENPELFKNNEAKNILKKILKIIQSQGSYTSSTYEDFEKFVLKEAFMLVSDLDGRRTLRIDVCRGIRKRADEKEEFIGGLLHALKHFEKEGVPLSPGGHTGTQLPKYFLNLIIEAFYSDSFKIQNSKSTTYESIVIDNGVSYRFIFYKQEKCDIYFLNTFFKIL